MNFRQAKPINCLFCLRTGSIDKQCVEMTSTSNLWAVEWILNIDQVVKVESKLWTPNYKKTRAA